MADFSKQYCDVWDPGFPCDFDIEEIATGIDNDHYCPMICEGFGFIAIGKDETGKIILAFRDNEDSEEVRWQDYETFMSSQYRLSEEENYDGNEII